MSAMEIEAGMEAVVFDNKLWGGRDHPDGNGRFWKPATILDVGRSRDGEEIATVRFHHDGRISHGHFTDGMTPREHELNLMNEREADA